MRKHVSSLQSRQSVDDGHIALLRTTTLQMLSNDVYVGIGCARTSTAACYLSRTDPKGRDGRLLDALFALLDLVARLAHAGLLILGEFGVATSLLGSLRLREGRVPPCVSPWTRGDRSP